MGGPRTRVLAPHNVSHFPHLCAPGCRTPLAPRSQKSLGQSLHWQAREKGKKGKRKRRARRARHLWSAGPSVVVAFVHPTDTARRGALPPAPRGRGAGASNPGPRELNRVRRSPAARLVTLGDGLGGVRGFSRGSPPPPPQTQCRRAPSLPERNRLRFRFPQAAPTPPPGESPPVASEGDAAHCGPAAPRLARSARPQSRLDPPHRPGSISSPPP